MSGKLRQSDAVIEDDGFGAINGRMCIVTRESDKPDDLIRFALGPDGVVVPDIKRQLPGRGCWVKAERQYVEKAIAKKLFARAFKKEVKAGPELVDMVDRLLVQQLAGMMNLARKASQFITGATKVDAAVRSGAALAVFHAADAAPDGVRKINQARTAWHLGMETEAAIPSIRPFTAAQMDELMGQNAFIHACVLAGQAGEGVVKRANMLLRYRDGGQSGAEGGAGRNEE